MPFQPDSLRSSVRTAIVSLLIAAPLVVGCGKGAQGPAGPSGPAGTAGDAGQDQGAIAGVIQDAAGAPLPGAAVSTTPVTQTAQTDATGHFTLQPVPIGTYDLVISLAGFTTAHLGVGVAATATSQVTVTLTPGGVSSGTVQGTIRGPPASAPALIAGAKVCVEGTTLCATTASDGTYSLTGVTPGPVYFTVTAEGLAPGEVRQAVAVKAGQPVPGIDVTLSGSPPVSAKFIGSVECVMCHTGLHQTELVTAWQASGHNNFTDRTMGHMDLAGWPAAPATCTSPSVRNTNVTATDPVDGKDHNVLLVRYKDGCGRGMSGAGGPQFAMALDSNDNGALDATDTLIPVNGTIGGIASGAGQCATSSGILPPGTPCAANFGGAGTTASTGWWQQEYLVDISAANKPTWVTWDTTGTPNDMLFLPIAWNQRGQGWANAPDYATDQSGTRSKKCAGCHDTGLTLAADPNGNVTTYAAIEQRIGCEKCHGPGSAHAATGDPKQILQPGLITARASTQMCGHCHSNAGASASPQAYGYAWNDKAAQGGGDFIPSVFDLGDFVALPAYGDSSTYWPALASAFPVTDHMTYVDFGASKHANNPFQKIACSDCHNAHGLQGGPQQFTRTDGSSGDKYAFGHNDLTLLNDVGCLSCHASQGSFASVALADVANFHIASGGTAQKNGTALAPGADEQAASTGAVASAVNAHMVSKAGMAAFFDPMGTTSGMPVGRCSSCHMAKTAATATYYQGLDATGRPANVSGDVSSHSFKVAWPQASIATLGGAATWSDVMPNACAACHAGYRFGVSAP